MRTFLFRRKVVMSELRGIRRLDILFTWDSSKIHTFPSVFSSIFNLFFPLLFSLSVVINVRCLARSMFPSCIITFIVVDSLLQRSHNVQMNGFSDLAYFYIDL